MDNETRRYLERIDNGQGCIIVLILAVVVFLLCSSPPRSERPAKSTDPAKTETRDGTK